MKRLLLFAAVTATAFAANIDWPTGYRTTPPIVNSVSPIGLARGMTTEMTVEGLNLAGASAVFFNQKGITGRILSVKEMPDLPEIRLGSNGTASTVDLGALPPRNQVAIEVRVPPKADIGAVGFRLQTPLGTSPEGEFLIEPFYGESLDREPNDTPDNAFEVYLPSVLAGTISRPGDMDFFKIHVKDGEQLTFENGAMLIGSTLQPVVSILAEDQSVLKEFGNDGGMDMLHFAYRFTKGGTYYIRVTDFENSGRASNFYRIMVGQFPVVTWAYPLGIGEGQSREVSLHGYNIGAGNAQVKGEPEWAGGDTMLLRASTASGRSFNEIRLAVGHEPEIESAGTNMSTASAQAVSVPATINGRIAAATNIAPVKNYYRFHAKKGEKIVLEVNARRLGSRLDSFVEVLDMHGNRIERALARPTLETTTTLSERDSRTPSFRLTSPAGFAVGDYLMVGQEIDRISEMPRGPDDDAQMERFAGQRLTFFDTTPEDHAIDEPVYKVKIATPGRHFAPNGLPLVKLYYQNDDGGPGYGKDSLVHFTAPADGDYIASIQDIRGQGGEDYPYRLTIRQPSPDFRLDVSPGNPNVPEGGSIPIQVTASRLDGFTEPIDVTVADLPPGLHASKGAIAAGQDSTTLLLSAERGAKLDLAAPLKVVGKAGIMGREVAHSADPGDTLNLVSLMPPADLQMAAEVKEVTLQPGGTAEVAIDVQRQNDFRGRVPVEVRNLPPSVRVLDVGLNGVLVTETQKRRTFKLQALPAAQPLEQLIYVAGQVETRSNEQTVYAAPEPILLKIVPKQAEVASR